MESKKQKVRVVSLFSGCGGGDLGLLGGFEFLGKKFARLEFEIIWANDILPFAVSSYKRNIGNHIVEGDITKIPTSDIPDHDLLIGGFPCQSFSIVGRRGGFSDPRGKLYSEMVRILRDKKPKAFIAENVKGLASIDGGKVLEKIINDFEESGYRVSYKILNASLYGVPQKRERLLIIGVLGNKDFEFNFPEPLSDKIPLSKVVENEEDVDKKYYFSERAIAGMKKANKAFNKGRAQSLTEPCNTVSTHLAKVSLNGTDPVLLVKENCYRRLTPKEAARIQSFPEDFIFDGTESKQYIQIGNAIPPVLMWQVAKEVENQIFNDKKVCEENTKQSEAQYSMLLHFT